MHMKGRVNRMGKELDRLHRAYEQAEADGDTYKQHDLAREISELQEVTVIGDEPYGSITKRVLQHISSQWFIWTVKKQF
jgi:hypothetical protein